MSGIPVCDRAWFVTVFRRLATGWYRVLRDTSPSCAVWQTVGGICLENFKSRSGKQCDGVIRWLPALAAWAAQPENPTVLTLDDGAELNCRQVLHDALVHGADPAHPDFWDNPPPERGNQRQVEASLVAWTLWLSRDWLFEELSPAQCANLQAWLAAGTAFSDHYNNWALFTAVNHAARIALRAHGFQGDLEAVRRDLLVGDELYLGDGWMWDAKYRGIDYYNFWVNGSHHVYLRAMLPELANPMLDRAIEAHRQRMQDLPHLIDRHGRNVLFGRSLSYRWGWLSGLVAAHYQGCATVNPGLSRAMLGRNLAAWLDQDSLAADGALRERLTAAGSDGARSSYINCGHPYWGMQAFLCLALPVAHPFWSAPVRALPCETAPFQIPRQGPGLVMQSVAEGRDVRLYNLRNLDGHDALYQKFVYSTAFPCNVDPHHRSLWDNQLALRLADGAALPPKEILEVDTQDGVTLNLVWRFELPAPAAPGASGNRPFHAHLHTTLRLSPTGYTTEHRIVTSGPVPAGARWVEGGFVLGAPPDRLPPDRREGLFGTAAGPDGATVETRGEQGWTQLVAARNGVSADGLSHCAAPPQIVTGGSLHFLLSTPVIAAAFDQPQVLCARHTAMPAADRPVG